MPVFLSVLGYSFCVLYTLAMMAMPVAAEKRAAFLVGNSAYESEAALRNPEADVRLVAGTLDALDFNVSTHFDLTRSEIAIELSEFLKANRNADLTLFYFAGHGMQFNNKNYLLGVDADLATTLDIDSDSVNLDSVIDLLAQNSKAAIVFVDACRDNPIANRFYSENFSATRASMTRGLARVANAFSGTMVTFSASPGQVAFDGDGVHSPFAEALARHLPAENVEVLSLMKRVTRDVRSATANQQTPTVTNDLVTEIYLQRGEGAEADAISYREEERLFEAAVAINTPRAWTVYFERYPNGQFYQPALEASEKATATRIAAVSGIGNATKLVSDAAQNANWLEFKQDAFALVESEFAIDRGAVRDVQAALNARGYDAGAVDGVLGNGTRRAIADFQLAIGLPSTGAITKGTAKALGVELARAEADNESFVASANARKYDPLQLALFEDDPRLLRAVEALRNYELVYGYFEDRIYIGVLTWRLDPYDDAIALAESAGGYLAAITSPAENEYIYKLVRNDLRFWKRHSDGRATAFGPTFGLYQLDGAREPDGGWVWITGEPLQYDNWLPGSPINANNTGKYASFIWDRWPEEVPGPVQTAPTWHDMDFAQMSLVIEIE